MPSIDFLIRGKSRTVEIRDLVVAGWTGRDAATVEHHIAELAAIGVARPRTVPCFYRVGVNLLTTSTYIDLTGSDSSGEVEFVLVSLMDGMYVGVGSDHTDRKVESYGVTVSKQMCPKPMSHELWPLSDVLEHWDDLILRSWVTRDSGTILYQEGPVTRMLPPLDLVARYCHGETKLPVGSAMFCGTLPLMAEMGPARQFEMELEDPILKRSLHHGYASRELQYND